jgi:hypothetical protein
MIFLLGTLAVIQGYAVSLGVGASTLAILNFFSAIADGKIDDTERRMMGIVYVVLRIAMVTILFSTLALLYLQFIHADLTEFTMLEWGQVIALFMLFLNAGLMTAHKMPSTFGPAIQAGNWYTLGFLTSLKALGLINFSLAQFFLAYITWLVLATAIVNGAMALMKAKRHGFLKS